MKHNEANHKETNRHEGHETTRHNTRRNDTRWEETTCQENWTYFNTGLYNVKYLLQDDNIVFNLNYKTNTGDASRHQVWKIFAEGFSKNNERLTVWTSLIHTWLDIRNSIHLIKPFIQDERSPFFTLRPSRVNFFSSLPLFTVENKITILFFPLCMFFCLCIFHDSLKNLSLIPLCSSHFTLHLQIMLISLCLNLRLVVFHRVSCLKYSLHFLIFFFFLFFLFRYVFSVSKWVTAVGNFTA